MNQNDEKTDKNPISNFKFATIIFVFCIFYFLIQKGKEKMSENLKTLIIKSSFIYLIKSILTKYLLNEKDKKILGKKNIITIIISVSTMALFILFDESNILI